MNAAASRTNRSVEYPFSASHWAGHSDRTSITIAKAKRRICSRSTPRERHARCSDEKIVTSMKVTSNANHEMNRGIQQGRQVAHHPIGFCYLKGRNIARFADVQGRPEHGEEWAQADQREP